MQNEITHNITPKKATFKSEELSYSCLIQIKGENLT